MGPPDISCLCLVTQILVLCSTMSEPISVLQNQLLSNERETILISGASGFIGSSLAKEFLSGTADIHDAHAVANTPRLILTDIVEPRIPTSEDNDGISSEDVISLGLDLSIPSEIDFLFTTPFGVPHTVYCMHGIMSAGSEKNFDLGLKVNVDSVRLLLDAARKYGALQKRLIKFIFTSSIAVYGGPLPEIVTADTAPWPQGAYGTEKLMSELLLNEYSRRGFIDGRILRLPTIVVRPGAPTAATSSFMSDIIREPLRGNPAICPIGTSLDSPSLDNLYEWLASPHTTVKNLVHARTIPAEAFVLHTRVVCLPGFTTTVREELNALKEVGGEAALALVQFKEEEDALISKLARSWPSRLDNTYALSLGFAADEGGMLPVVHRYAEELKKGVV